MRVFAFDITPEEGAKGVDRDPEMARRVRAAFGQAPAGRLLVLSGNVHAMRQPPPFDGFQQPMGSFLADLDPFSVNISARGGEYWACQGSCGPQRQPDSGAESGLDRSGTFHLNIVLPRFTIARLIED